MNIFTNIVDFFKVVAIGVGSMLVFSFIFTVLNNIILNPFKPIQKITRKLKHKDKFYILFFFFVTIGSTEIKEWLELGDMGFGISWGFLYALNDVIFEKGYQNKDKEMKKSH